MQLSDPNSVSMDAERLARLTASVQRDIDANLCDGAVLAVARHGKPVFFESIGYADRKAERKMQVDDIFPLLSLTKSLTNVLVLNRIERGDLQFVTQAAEIIPEFGAVGKKHITVAQLLGHKGGLGGMLPIPPEVMPNLEACVAAVCGIGIQDIPEKSVSYSGIAAHAILGELVRRVDGGKRSFGQIFRDDLLVPLGMNDTSLGRPAGKDERCVPLVVRDRRESLLPPHVLESHAQLLFEGSEIPGVGGLSTVNDIFRFAEMLRRGGELDGVRILSPLTIDLATENYTGDKVNKLWDFARESRGWPEFPAYLGLGFYLRGTGIFPNYFGSLASPGTFGGCGAGSTLFWVDPVNDMTFVGLSSGLMEESYNVERWQRLSDIALSSIIKR